MTTIISALLPVLLKMIGMYFSKKGSDKEAKEAWINFLDKMKSNVGASTRIRSSVNAQLDRLKKGEGK